MVTGSGSSSGTRGCFSHEKSYQGQRSRWNAFGCQSWNAFALLLSNLPKFKLGCPFTSSKSKSRLRSPMVSLSLLLIAALILESSMVSCLPVIPANHQENPSSTSQVPPRHPHHHRHHHHQRERTKHHPKHFQLESLEAVDTGGSLSIVTPLDVLRQNMLLEIARKRHREAKSKQVKLNTEFLERIG